MVCAVGSARHSCHVGTSLNERLRRSAQVISQGNPRESKRVLGRRFCVQAQPVLNAPVSLLKGTRLVPLSTTCTPTETSATFRLCTERSRILRDSRRRAPPTALLGTCRRQFRPTGFGVRALRRTRPAGAASWAPPEGRTPQRSPTAANWLRCQGSSLPENWQHGAAQRADTFRHPLPSRADGPSVLPSENCASKA